MESLANQSWISYRLCNFFYSRGMPSYCLCIKVSRKNNQVWVSNGNWIEVKLKVICKGLKPIFRLNGRSIQRDKITCFVSNFYFKVNTFLQKLNMSWFEWRVMVSGEIMFLESYGNCDVTNTVSLYSDLIIWRVFFTLVIYHKHRAAQLSLACS